MLLMVFLYTIKHLDRANILVVEGTPLQPTACPGDTTAGGDISNMRDMSLVMASSSYQPCHSSVSVCILQLSCGQFVDVSFNQLCLEKAKILLNENALQWFAFILIGFSVFCLLIIYFNLCTTCQITVMFTTFLLPYQLIHQDIFSSGRRGVQTCP